MNRAFLSIIISLFRNKLQHFVALLIKSELLNKLFYIVFPHV